MSEIIKVINSFFRNAIKKDVDTLYKELLLTDRQKKIFQMFYIEKKNIDFIADELCVCRMVVNNELKIIRKKIYKIWEHDVL